MDRIRRQDPIDVLARHVNARYPEPSGRDVWRGGKPDADLERHQRGAGRSGNLATPAAGIALCHRLHGRAVRKDARQQPGEKPRGVCGHRGESRGMERGSGVVDGDHEGAKLWLQVLTEIKNRGVEDIFIACVDGLKGFPEAIELMYPQAQVQLCIVHMVRHSLNYVPWKQRRLVAADLRTIYTAATAEAAAVALRQFGDKWDASYAPISEVWRRNWERIIPFFAFPAEIRKVIYTTNAVESLNMSLRKIIKTRGSFPNEEAALRLLWLALRNHSKKWSFVQNWREALNRFQILWPERMPALERS